MSEDRYSEKLAWFKQNEKPEVVLFIADNPELTKTVVAWTSLKVSRAQKLTPLPDDSESEAWEWLWRNAQYSRAELMDKIGVSFSEAGLESRMRPLIGNRILYPDGTVNSFVQRYLRDQVLKLFATKAKHPARKAP